VNYLLDTHVFLWMLADPERLTGAKGMDWAPGWEPPLTQRYSAEMAKPPKGGESGGLPWAVWQTIECPRPLQDQLDRTKNVATKNRCRIRFRSGLERVSV
jgi:hypothetical protein